MGAIYARLSDAEATFPLLTHQTTLPKRYVVLTGGLSRNTYIREAMRDRVRRLDDRPIELIIPDGDLG